MTQEQAKKYLPLIQALADGKVVQEYNHESGQWEDSENPRFVRDRSFYRIKPEIQYRPFETLDEIWEEFKKHKPIGWIKNKSGDTNLHVSRVEYIDNCMYFLTASFHGLERFNAQFIFKCFTFMDGAPLGIKET